jgi:cellulose synthase/poly-beta-1,6-N-acetylglucosamine synthase-like glycosyltransferase
MTTATSAMNSNVAVAGSFPTLSLVVIGRNEGQRLVRCLESVELMRLPLGDTELIYVDSASSDSSVERALRYNAKVLSLQSAHPNAAAARNLGWHAARAEIVMFLDGDTVLDRDFVADSIGAFSDPLIAVVFGHRRELNPRASLYNRVVDLDWMTTPGPAEFCGGDALIRRQILESVGGYDDQLIAGEEPELCRRIRAAGYLVLHVDRPMSLHDLGMTRFSQYWRRGLRSGYAYAEVSRRYRGTDLPLWSHESRRNLLQGGAMLAIVVGAPLLAIAGQSLVPLFAAIIVVCVLVARTALRYQWKARSLTTRLLYGLHSHLGHIPILFGQLKYHLDRYLGKRAQLIEYHLPPTRKPPIHQA